MFKKQGFIGAMVGLLLLSIHPQISVAKDEFTSSQFLNWNRSSQESFVNTSLLMALHVVAQSDKAYAKCLTEWFNAEKKQRFSTILETIERNQRHNPQLVMLAVVERECGGLDFSGSR